MPLNIATIRAELTAAPAYRIATCADGAFVVLTVGPLQVTSDDPTELRRLADVCANAADVLTEAQCAKALPPCCSQAAHDRLKDAATFRATTTYVGRQSDGAGGWLELRNCLACPATLAMDEAEIEAAEAARDGAVAR